MTGITRAKGATFSTYHLTDASLRSSKNTNWLRVTGLQAVALLRASVMLARLPALSYW